MRISALVLATSVAAAVLASSGAAQADKVFLSGGTVLDGKVERKGGKVIVEGESGTIAVPADSVVKIEKGEAALSRFEAEYATLRPKDVAGRLALADFCRSNDMKSSERRVLLEVIAIEPDNAQARARLGYVKTESGWATEADAMRARGMVMYEGQWMSEGAVQELERMRAQVADAARQQEDAQLSARRAQLDADQAALEAERDRHFDSWGNSVYFGPVYRTTRAVYPRYGYGAGVVGSSYGRQQQRVVRQTRVTGPDTSMSVVKVPYRYH
jgi:hypothetical protein